MTREEKVLNDIRTELRKLTMLKEIELGITTDKEYKRLFKRNSPYPSMTKGEDE